MKINFKKIKLKDLKKLFLKNFKSNNEEEFNKFVDEFWTKLSQSNIY